MLCSAEPSMDRVISHVRNICVASLITTRTDTQVINIALGIHGQHGHQRVTDSRTKQTQIYIFIFIRDDNKRSIFGSSAPHWGNAWRSSTITVKDPRVKPALRATDCRQLCRRSRYKAATVQQTTARFSCRDVIVAKNICICRMKRNIRIVDVLFFNKQTDEQMCVWFRTFAEWPECAMNFDFYGHKIFLYDFAMNTDTFTHNVRVKLLHIFPTTWKTVKMFTARDVIHIINPRWGMEVICLIKIVTVKIFLNLFIT